MGDVSKLFMVCMGILALVGCSAAQTFEEKAAAVAGPEVPAPMDAVMMAGSGAPVPMEAPDSQSPPLDAGTSALPDAGVALDAGENTELEPDQEAEVEPAETPDAGPPVDPFAPGDRTANPDNPPECPAVAPDNPIGDCLGLPVYVQCNYTTYHCVCDWYHWLCI